MTTLARRNSSIHKIREYSLKQARFEDEYEILRDIQESWRSRLLLVEHKQTRNEVVLKAAHKEVTKKEDFFREFHYNYYLSPHPNILNAYDVSFESQGYYIFAQEYAPFGDVTSNFSEQGLGEINTKKVAVQIASALEFMHSKDLVHRDINMDNILVFNIDFSEVKLCDFGETRKEGSFLKKKTVWLPYAPPEIVDTVQNEGYYVDKKQDIWQFGMLLYVLLTGSLPWQKADITDPFYVEYLNWKNRKLLKTPRRFTNFTSRGLRLLKRFLEPKMDKRVEIKEVYKYIDQKWLLKAPKKSEKEVDNQSLCYSNYSIHSSKPEKDKILEVLKAHGIETTVDRSEKRKRIHEWIKRTIPDNLQAEAPLQQPSQQITLKPVPIERPLSFKEPDIINDLNAMSLRDPSHERKNTIVRPVPIPQNLLNNITKETPVPIQRSRRESSVQLGASPGHTTTSHQLYEMFVQGTESPSRVTYHSPSRDSPFRQPVTELKGVVARPPRAKNSRAAARSHSARMEKSQMKHRSRSLVRDPFSDYDLQRSKTDPDVDARNDRQHEYPESGSDNESLSSIVPMTGH